MLNASTNQREIRKIDAQIKRLQAQKALLQRQEPADWLMRIRLPGERVNARNFDKLVALAHVLNFLMTEDGKEGASTSQISKYLNNAIGLEIKSATLRSYLFRYKEEGRLLFDKKSRLWRIP
ncbi:MAG: hypothetical protein AAF331_12020 [Pseudomonadota bacterium]